MNNIKKLNTVKEDTIAAIATAKGAAGVGIIRISGPETKSIAEKILGCIPDPRKALYTDFCDHNKLAVDSGVALFFPGPNSFTGEDVLELQGHGGPVILDCMLDVAIKAGARLAKPGEFSERAFLNNKIDLAQAEAILDLIHAQSKEAALAATKTLKGVFSEKISELEKNIIDLRVFVEAAIDFPDEELDFIQNNQILKSIDQISLDLKSLLKQVETGTKVTEGLKVVILGKPNAGKSSILNVLSGEDRAIVTDIPGTTRDIIHNTINISGITLHLIDTAGLRDTEDLIELEGIKRALNEINDSDILMIVIDGSTELDLDPFFVNPVLKEKISPETKIVTLINKIDKLNLEPKVEKISDREIRIFVSAKQKIGFNLIEEVIREISGLHSGNEGVFSARRRHISAIERSLFHVNKAVSEFELTQATEILAEELRLAHLKLSEITGEFSSDDLLGKIFSEFCIGK